MSNTAFSDDDMSSIYEPPPKKEQTKAVIGFRAEKSLKADLVSVERLWREVATAKGDDVDAIDFSYVCIRLLKVGVDSAFAEFGGKPTSEEDWKRVTRLIAKNVRPEKP